MCLAGCLVKRTAMKMFHDPQTSSVQAFKRCTTLWALPLWERALQRLCGAPAVGKRKRREAQWKWLEKQWFKANHPHERISGDRERGAQEERSRTASGNSVILLLRMSRHSMLDR